MAELEFFIVGDALDLAERMRFVAAFSGCRLDRRTASDDATASGARRSVAPCSDRLPFRKAPGYSFLSRIDNAPRIPLMWFFPDETRLFQLSSLALEIDPDRLPKLDLNPPTSKPAQETRGNPYRIPNDNRSVATVCH